MQILLYLRHLMSLAQKLHCNKTEADSDQNKTNLMFIHLYNQYTYEYQNLLVALEQKLSPKTFA